jgi:tetratricopeptide (TPR) repeat protein
MEWGSAGKGAVGRAGRESLGIFLAYPSSNGQLAMDDSERFELPGRDSMAALGPAGFANLAEAASEAMMLCQVPSNLDAPLPPIAQEDLEYLSQSFDRFERGLAEGYRPSGAALAAQFAGLIWRARPSKNMARILDGEWVSSFSSRTAERALAIIDSGLSAEPSNPDALKEKITILQELGRPGDAAKVADALADAGGEPTPESWMERGAALARSKEHLEALRFYEKALSSSPDLVECWILKGDSLFAIGRYAEAGMCYDYAISRRPDDPVLAKKKAGSLAKLGEVAKASEVYPSKKINRAEEQSGTIDGAHEYSEKQSGRSVDQSDGGPKGRSLAKMLTGLASPPIATETVPPEPDIPSSRGYEDRKAAAKPQDREEFPHVSGAPSPQPELAKAIEGKLDDVVPSSEVDRLIEAGEKLLEDEDYDAALEIFEEGLGLDGGNEEAMAGKAKALSGIGRSDEAVSLLEKWLGKAPESLILLEAKGDVLESIGKNYTALEAYDAALEQDREDPVLWNKKGEALLGLGKFEEALGAFNEAVEMDEEYSDAWLGIGDSFFGLGKLDEAYKCFDKALELDETLTEAWYKKGTVLDAKGRWGGALQLYERAISLDPEYAEPRLSVAAALAGRQKYPEALRAYDEVLSKRPTEPRAMTGKASVYRSMGRWGAALQLLSSLTKEHPEHAPGWILLGRIMKEQRQPDKAMAHFDRALEIEPENPDALLEKAWLLHENGGFSEALRHFKMVAQISPRSRSAWLGVAESLKEMGDRDNAIASFDKALDIVSGDAGLWLKRGIALHEFERYAEAIASYDKALSIDRNLEEAKRWRERSAKRLAEGGAR